MFKWLPGLERRRRRLLRNAPPGPLADYLRTPFPSRKSPVNEVEFLAVDLETTGLDPKQDEILSIGCVPIRHLRITLGGSSSMLLKPEGAIPASSAVVHRIFDDQAAQGMPLTQAIPLLLRQLSGKVLVAHHAPIETEFLRQACRRLYACDVVFPTVDTLVLERRWIDRRQVTLASGGLRLAAIRDRYGLPRYPVHNALSDALATAELLLAQIAYRGGARQVRLKHLLI